MDFLRAKYENRLRFKTHFTSKRVAFQNPHTSTLWSFTHDRCWIDGTFGDRIPVYFEWWFGYREFLSVASNAAAAGRAKPIQLILFLG